MKGLEWCHMRHDMRTETFSLRAKGHEGSWQWPSLDRQCPTGREQVGREQNQSPWQAVCYGRRWGCKMVTGTWRWQTQACSQLCHRQAGRLQLPGVLGFCETAFRILLGPFKHSRVHGEKYQPKIRESFLTQQFRKHTKTQVFSKGGNFLLLAAHKQTPSDQLSWLLKGQFLQRVGFGWELCPALLPV